MQEYVELLEQYLNAEALAFVKLFAAYAHRCDDIIDGDLKNPEDIIVTFEMAATVYSMPFYQKNIARIFPVIKVITNMYMDSVALEKGDKEWQLRTARVLSHAFNELIVACVEIVNGYDARRIVSMKLREFSHLQQEEGTE